MTGKKRRGADVRFDHRRRGHYSGPSVPCPPADRGDGLRMAGSVRWWEFTDRQGSAMDRETDHEKGLNPPVFIDLDRGIAKWPY